MTTFKHTIREVENSRTNRAGRKRMAGFSLVEVLVSSVLLAMVVASSLALYLQITRSAQMVRRATDATSIAWSRIERARNLEFDEMDELIEEAPGTMINEAGLPDANGNYLRRTLISTETNGLVTKRIRIEVMTRGPASSDFGGQPEVMETLITDVPR